MKNSEILIAAAVAMVAICGLVIWSNGSMTGAATNPGLKCDGQWSYLGLYGGLQCIESYEGPRGGSHAGGGGGLGSWDQPRDIREDQGGGLTKAQLDLLKERARIDRDYK